MRVSVAGALPFHHCNCALQEATTMMSEPTGSAGQRREKHATRARSPRPDIDRVTADGAALDTTNTAVLLLPTFANQQA
jgi:hypothetical protein